MKQYLIFIAILMFISGCAPNQKKSESTAKVVQELNIASYTLDNLQGVWAENNENNALFFIEKDTLYYTEEQHIGVNIRLNKDTLMIMGNVPVVCKILKLSEDTLWYIDEYNDIPTKLYKRK